MTEPKHIRTFRSKKLHPEHVKLINEAIRHNARGKDKDVHITYRKENGEVSDRKVRPLAVKGKSLFVAHCHERDAIRSFRVERITMVKKAFWEGFEKRAWFWSKKNKNQTPQELPQEHVKAIMPHFQKSEKARKLLLAGKITDDEFMVRSRPYLDAVASTERVTGIDNYHIYNHFNSLPE